jgi:PleD family two-component response regulator
MGRSGKGSEMVVRLPILEQESAEPAGSEVSGARPTENAKFRILVVDDNADSAEAIGKLLQLEGHEVRCAFDGASAVAVSGATARPE